MYREYNFGCCVVPSWPGARHVGGYLKAGCCYGYSQVVLCVQDRLAFSCIFCLPSLGYPVRRAGRSTRWGQWFRRVSPVVLLLWADLWGCLGCCCLPGWLHISPPPSFYFIYFRIFLHKIFNMTITFSVGSIDYGFSDLRYTRQGGWLAGSAYCSCSILLCFPRRS